MVQQLGSWVLCFVENGCMLTLNLLDLEESF